MKLYIKVYFSSGGMNPLKVVEKLKGLGFEPVIGQYDFVKGFESPDDYIKLVNALHEALKDTGAFYTLQTRKE